jgi:hypothetical protein
MCRRLASSSATRPRSCEQRNRLRICRLTATAGRKPQENNQRLVQAIDYIGLQLPDPSAYLATRHGRDLVDQKMADFSQPISCTWSNGQAHQRGVCFKCREDANGDRSRVAKTIALDDHRGPRLSGVSGAGDRPNLAASHSFQRSAEIASINAWSSASCGLFAIASDCRRASAINSGESTSGTQIWIGRNPWRRSSAR